MNMLEQVARAMLAADYPDDVGSEMESLWWDRHGETYLRYARVAIEAMRAPTEAMIASAEAGDDPGSSIFGDPFVPLPHDEAWRCMVDAALEEAR